MTTGSRRNGKKENLNRSSLKTQARSREGGHQEVSIISPQLAYPVSLPSMTTRLSPSCSAFLSIVLSTGTLYQNWTQIFLTLSFLLTSSSPFPIPLSLKRIMAITRCNERTISWEQVGTIQCSATGTIYVLPPE